MDGRRTYLDSLNAGRQRRAHSTLDDLNKSLERLGQRLDRREERAPENFQQAKPRPSLAEEVARRRLPEEPQVAPREEPQNSAARIAAEMKSLRDELRSQLATGLQSEFESLRGEISRAARSQPDARSSQELTGELERLSDSIHQLSSRSDDKGVALLRLDIEQIKRELESLAREDTVQSFDRRWDQMDRRWNDLESRIDSRGEGRDGFAALHERLQEITNAVSGLPDSRSLRSLEDKVRTLAGAVDQFASHRDDSPPKYMNSLEQRLEEISRAIVASTVAAQPQGVDVESIARIEARISNLARNLENMQSHEPNTEIIERLNTLSQRVEDVARQADVPAKSVERLSNQIALIAERIDSGSHLPDASAIMHGIEDRFERFADALERRQDNAFEINQKLFRDLETRLQGVVNKLDARPAGDGSDNAVLMDAIDARLDDFSRQLEARKADILDKNAVRGLEAKLETLSNKMNEPRSSALNIDADAIRNLESQVAGLSAFLHQPDKANVADALAPRLDKMERALTANRDVVLDAARKAAEEAMLGFKGSQTDMTAISGLTADLKALENLTIASDDKNSRTFEAIHDTLLKIVDRLGSLENAPAPRKIAIEDVPPMQVEDSFPVVRDETQRNVPQEEIEAVEALELDAAVEAPQNEKKSKSMLRGLGRAFAGRVAAASGASAAATPPATEPAFGAQALDEPLDPKSANRPLEPGSGAPDLSSIMRRVREERVQPSKPADADAAKSDFIAAARRAAQAAAAEAEVLKRHSDISGPGRGLKIGDIFKARRKSLLMGAVAVMVALVGYQLGSAFMSGKENFASVETPAVQIEQTPQVAAMTSAAEPATVAAITPSAPAEAAPQEDVRNVDNLAKPGDMSVPPGAMDASAQAVPSSPPATAETPAPVPAEQVAAIPKAPVDAGPVALREAADGGDPRAMFEIAARYSEGRGTKADNGKAAEWYERSAELGLAPAQYRIGNMYEKGVGVTRDLKKAKTWYQMSAEQGNASAMHNLAVLYAMGADGTPDNDSAARWFLKAGDLGVKDSQFNLGILAAKGVGMPQSLEESYKWFALVAKAGDADAAQKRDEVANSLRPEQLQRARAAAELWKAKPVAQEANTVEVPDEWQESKEKTAGIDMKKAVQSIQLILNKNGYDAGGADGVMGSKTKDAIVAFQKDNNLPANGQVTEQLVQQLLAKK